jgi:site-specific DNA recombinase
MTVPKAFEKAFRDDPNAAGRIVRVGVYTRVSSDKQFQFGGSFTDQKVRAPEFIKKIQPTGQTWEIYKIYEEGGITGHTEDRPQLQMLMGDARQHKFDFVVITMVDRLWRDLRLLLNYSHELVDELGIHIISMDGKLDTRQHGYKSVLVQRGQFAEEEWDVRSERAKSVCERGHRDHEWVHGRPPYGYRFDHSKITTQTDHLIICEDEAGVIRLIFRWYTTEHIGALQIATRLNEMNIAPPRAKRKKIVGWQDTSVLEVLHHHIYKGGWFDKQDDPECWYRAPAIVDVETWFRAQQVIVDNKGVDFDAEPKSEFSHGRLRCGLCGLWMRLQENGDGSFSYECIGRKKNAHPDGSPRCIMPRMHWRQTDSVIHEKLNAICTKDEMVKEIRTNTDYLKKERAKLASQQKPISQEEIRIRKAMQMNVTLAKHWLTNHDAGISPEEFDAEQSRLEKELADLISSKKTKNDHQETMTLGPEIAVLDASIAELEEYAIEIEDPQYDFDVSQGDYHDWEHFVHDNIPAPLKSDTAEIEKRYNIPQIMTKFSMPKTFTFTILPNEKNPKDKDHPQVFPNPPDYKKYPYVIVGEADLNRQINPLSACSR